MILYKNRHWGEFKHLKYLSILRIATLVIPILKVLATADVTTHKANILDDNQR